MRNLGSKLFFLAVATLIVAGLGYAFWPQPVDVDLVPIERGLLRVTVDEDGKTRIHDKYVVSAPLQGRTARINLDPGDEVCAGQTLLTTIDPPDPALLDARAVTQAEARVKAAEAAMRQAEPNLEKAREAQYYAESEVVRARQAHTGKGISLAELEEKEMLNRQRSEELRTARIAQEIAKFELEQAQAALIRSRPPAENDPPDPSQQASTASVKSNGGADGNSNVNANHDENVDENSGWTFPVCSPISGRVLRVFQKSAAVVTPGTPLVEIGNLADLEVEIDVLSRDAVRIQPGNLVLLEHWGGEKPLEGRVRLIEPSGFTKISTLGVEEQRVWVIVDLVDPPEKRRTLGDAFRVDARIVVDEAPGVLKVPTSALFRVGGDTAVFCVTGGVVHQRHVKVGRQNGLEAEVLDGLAEGDTVVLHPSDRVEDGVKVRQRTTR